MTTAPTDDRAVDLADGTVVALYEYGDPSGSPVLAFHGTPSRGTGFDFTDEPARARGQRVLAPDRPGISRFLLASSAFFANRGPKAAMGSFLKQLSESDRAVVVAQDPAPADAVRLFTRAFQHGAKGVVDDYRVIAEPWGVELGHTGPLTIFQGDADPMVPRRS